MSTVSSWRYHCISIFSFSVVADQLRAVDLSSREERVMHHLGILFCQDPGLPGSRQCIAEHVCLCDLGTVSVCMHLAKKSMGGRVCMKDKWYQTRYSRSNWMQQGLGPDSDPRSTEPSPCTSTAFPKDRAEARATFDQSTGSRTVPAGSLEST